LLCVREFVDYVVDVFVTGTNGDSAIVTRDGDVAVVGVNGNCSGALVGWEAGKC